MVKPLIFIASLQRTGSTVLSEALTQLPHCYVFREPHLSANRFSLKPGDAEAFAPYGVDLEKLAKKWAWQKYLGLGVVRNFRRDLVEGLDGRVEQLGVKEIHLEGWREYLRIFPDMKVVMTGRDPRDIYISIHERIEQGKARWHGEFSADSVAAKLNGEFDCQRGLSQATECLKVRYEDLCTDAGVVERVKVFAGCSVPIRAGSVGQFNAANPLRRGEFELHGGKITDRRVERWKGVSDPRVSEQASRMPELMRGYCAFWGYAA